MRKKNYYVYEKPYVYIVLEHATATTDAILHGVYTTFKSAYGKYWKISWDKKIDRELGYFCILKKPVQGRRVKTMATDWDGAMTIIPIDDGDD